MAEKRKTKTSSAVKNRYNSRVYGSIIVRVPKEMAEAFKEKCAATGTGASASYQEGNRRILGGIKRSYGGRQDMPPFFFRRGRNTNAQTLNVDGSP